MTADLTGQQAASDQPAPGQPKVAVLMATYNGAAHLAAQLQSLAAQDWPHWQLHASDDGSQDATGALLHEFQARMAPGQVRLRRGPARGFVANFLSLACAEDIQADLYAFCDQDDLWLPGKLRRAVDRLSGLPGQQPLLYCARTLNVDAADRPLGLSPAWRRPAAFGNALTQNVAAGNTIVFNAAARRLVQRAGADVQVPVHDWWLYLLVAGCGGCVTYDDAPVLRYRQHGANLIGASAGLGDRLARARGMWGGRHRAWHRQHEAALERVADLLHADAARALALFRQARGLPLPRRLAAYRRSGIYRQTALGTLALWAMAVANRL